MSSSQEPSPLSLGAPQQAPSPQSSTPPGMQTDDQPRPTRASLPRLVIQQAPSLSLPRGTPLAATARVSLPPPDGPSITQKLLVLDEFLKRCQADHETPRVIAVDGLDRDAVQRMIANLYHYITRSLGYTVRVMGESYHRPPTNQAAEMSYYLIKVLEWGEVWKAMTQASAASLEAASNIVDRRPSISPCLWIVPLSPISVTLRSADRIPSHDTVDLFRYLASHWTEYLRPYITVHIQDVVDTSRVQEVIRFSGSNMNTIIITKLPDGDLTAQQFRRTAFEVGEWLYCWHYGEPEN